MSAPKVYADFHNADAKGRPRLNCVGTTRDLARRQLRLERGLALTVYADDADGAGGAGGATELQADGRVEYSEEEGCWVAVIDWDAIRHVPAATTAAVSGQ